MKNLLQNFSGAKPVTFAMWAAVLIMSFIVVMAILTSGTS